MNSNQKRCFGIRRIRVICTKFVEIDLIHLLFKNVSSILSRSSMNLEVDSSNSHDVIQTHKCVNEGRIRMFRPTDMDPRIKGVIRRPRIVSITW